MYSSRIFIAYSVIGGNIFPLIETFVFSWKIKIIQQWLKSVKFSKEPSLNFECLLSSFNLARDEGALDD